MGCTRSRRLLIMISSAAPLEDAAAGLAGVEGLFADLLPVTAGQAVGGAHGGGQFGGGDLTQPGLFHGTGDDVVGVAAAGLVLVQGIGDLHALAAQLVGQAAAHPLGHVVAGHEGAAVTAHAEVGGILAVVGEGHHGHARGVGGRAARD